mgnify:CR=1 FL=1
MIDIKGLKKSFGENVVLKGVDLSIEEREVVVIIGPSGSGKSTLLRCMNYLEEPTAGTVTVDGILLDGEANINKVREEVGMVFQRFNLFPHMTVLQNIMLAPQKVRHVSRDEAERTAKELLARVGLADKADVYPEQLSGGQQQRVAIARALAMHPKVMLFDEPTSALDPEMVGEGLDVAMVLAGLPSSVSSVLNDKVLTFLNRARKLEVSELAIGEVDVFYRRALRSEGIQIASTLRRRAAEATQGSPYLMQLIGHYLVEYSDRGQPTDEATLSEALTSARFEFEDDVCSTTLAALSAGDVRYLDGMARLGAPCRSAQVAQEMGETIDYAQQYRRRLMQAGVIEAPRRGCVDFAVPYLQDYLRRGQLR